MNKNLLILLSMLNYFAISTLRFYKKKVNLKVYLFFFKSSEELFSTIKSIESHLSSFLFKTELNLQNQVFG